VEFRIRWRAIVNGDTHCFEGRGARLRLSSGSISCRNEDHGCVEHSHELPVTFSWRVKW